MDSKKSIVSQISECLWSKILRKQYTLTASQLHLSAQQVNCIIQSENYSQLQSILTPQQNQAIQAAISSSPSKAIFVKINNRTPKDVVAVSRQIRKVQDFLMLLHSSQYLLDGFEKGRPAEVILRQYSSDIIHNIKVYQIYARGGFCIAIGQKYCDHIQPNISDQDVWKIFDIVQQVMPGVTLLVPKDKGFQINSFKITLHLNGNMPKITSICPYPFQNQPSHSIFSKNELQTYFDQIQKDGKHKSSQEKYQINEGVIPLIKAVTKVEDIKHYDMGEYLVGNELDTQQKLQEWKEFMKQASKKLEQ